MGLHVVPATCVKTQQYAKKKKKSIKIHAFNTCVFKILNVSFCCGCLMEKGKLMLQTEVKRGFYHLTLLLCIFVMSDQLVIASGK